MKNYWSNVITAMNVSFYHHISFLTHSSSKEIKHFGFYWIALGDAKITAITTKPVDVKPPMSTTSDEKCSCDENARDGKGSIFEKDAEQLIEFEDELHNTVYVWYVCKQYLAFCWFFLPAKLELFYLIGKNHRDVNVETFQHMPLKLLKCFGAYHVINARIIIQL